MTHQNQHDLNENELDAADESVVFEIDDAEILGATMATMQGDAM